ncbi:MAG: hypothetical protein GX660_20740 [Clostridiaceae bacterium]|nr:hypothetical protein [Clostridiaceae bacterium]
MNIHNRGKYLISFGLLILIGTIVIISSSTTDVHASNKADKTIILASEFIKENPYLLSQCVQTVEDSFNISDETLAWVNDIPISIEEFNFRQGLKKVIGDKDQDDKSVFNILVEEKIILDFAIKNNIVPTNSELEEFIAYESNIDNTGQEYKDMVELICKYAEMSEEEYYNTYEKYNAFRVLLLKNAYDYAIKNGQQNGHLAIDNEDDAFAEQHEKITYWYDVKKELKNTAIIKIDEKHEEFGIILDTAKIYK